MPVMGIEPTGEETGWTINVNVDEMDFIRQANPNVNDDQFQIITGKSLDIISNFPEPNGSDAQTTGLVIGKVQSGKTLSFTTVVALAGNNGYRVIIVLAGTTNALLKQTHERLEAELGTQRSQASRFLVLKNPSIRDEDFVSTALSRIADNTILIVCLKRAGQINEVRALLSLPDMPQVPTLIIDDEGDEASHNRMPSRRRVAINGGNAAPIRESATHRSIRLLRESLSKHAYVAYTATPQSNLLLPRIAELSPTFCELIRPGPGYCGGSTFFGDNTINRYVRPIRREDEDPDVGTMTPSMKRALSAFFVSAAIRHIRAPNQKHTMLIHTTHIKDEHQIIRGAVQTILADWRTRMGHPSGDPSRQDLIALFQESYRDFLLTVNNAPSWDQVLERLERELYYVEVHMYNSLPEAAGAAERVFRRMNNIVVGGNMLSRGVTVKELAITYITRVARTESNADTIEQRARWFGYKEGYLDLCRIWMTSRLREIYVDLLRHEDDFWESLERHQRQGIPISEWPRFFRLDNANLRPTRANVARSERFSIRGWKVMQPIVPALKPTVAAENLQVVDRFIIDRESEPLRVGNVDHSIYRGVPLTHAIETLVSLIEGGKNWDTEYLSEYLRRLQFAHILENIDIVLIRPNDATTFRTPDGNTDGARINPMQGPSPNRRPTDPLYYPGDGNFHGGMPQLQIHRYLYRDNGPRTCSLSIYLPEEDRFDLSYIVGGEDI